MFAALCCFQWTPHGELCLECYDLLNSKIARGQPTRASRAWSESVVHWLEHRATHSEREERKRLGAQCLQNCSALVFEGSSAHLLSTLKSTLTRSSSAQVSHVLKIVLRLSSAIAWRCCCSVLQCALLSPSSAKSVCVTAYTRLTSRGIITKREVFEFTIIVTTEQIPPLPSYHWARPVNLSYINEIKASSLPWQLWHFILQTGPLNNRLNLFLSATESVSLCCMVSYLVFGLVCLREYAAAEERPCVSTPGGHFLLLPSPPTGWCAPG